MQSPYLSKFDVLQIKIQNQNMAPCIRFLQQEYKLFAKGEVKGGGGQIHVYIGYPNQFQVIPNLSNKCKIKQFSWDLKLT